MVGTNRSDISSSVKNAKYVWIEVRVSSETEIARNLLGTCNDVLRKWKDPSNCGSEGNCCFERGAKLERCIQGLNE